MVSCLLGEATATVRRLQPLTYEGAGRTRTVPPPHGYTSFTETRKLRATTDFESAAQALMSWQVQIRAGLHVAASTMQIVESAVCVMTLGRPPFGLTIPCKVIYIIAAPDERGFAYGTLPGHPESGEEAFILRRDADGAAHFTITAFSRPATLLAKIGGPLTRQCQRAMTRRYLNAMDR